ncbi:MAG: aspartate aminotransferase family protein [Phototrophicaceae bacterium]
MSDDILDSTDTQDLLADGSEYLTQNYARAPFVLKNGKGMWLYDTEGKVYLDFVAGIAVNAFGYGDEGLIDTIRQASLGLWHISNLYHNAPQIALAKSLIEKSGMKQVFFCNSGAEANEAALKFARKVAYQQHQPERNKTIVFSNAFHGRTFGVLSLTPREKYQKPFAPLLSNVEVLPFNDIDALHQAISNEVTAVFIEPIQGEGGINIADAPFLQTLRDLCNQHGVILVFDEVQCGMARTGDLFAHEYAGVKPDILTLAKPLGAGLPIGATLVNERVAQAIEYGDHGSTFAGGSLVTTVAHEVLQRLSEPALLEHVRVTGQYLLEKLQQLTSPHVVAVRGRGLMCALELDVSVQPLVSRGYEHGLLLVSAGANIIRFVPPLIVETSHIDQMVSILQTLLNELD